MGVREEHIRTAVSKRPRILCSSVDKNMRPNIGKLLEVGLSVKDISRTIASNPTLLACNILAKIDFWLGVLESVDHLQVLLNFSSLFSRALMCNIMPNVSYLRDRCAFSPRQIMRLIKSNARIISSPPGNLINLTERAKGLGIDPSTGNFVHAIIIVNFLNQSIIDARIENFTNLGLSHEEVKLIIRKCPFVLSISEELVCRKFEFLTNEMGCDKAQLVSNPSLFNYSLESRLIPRSIVWKLLMSKGLAKTSYSSCVIPTEENFVDKYVLPNEDAIPGLYQKYVDARKKLRG